MPNETPTLPQFIAARVAEEEVYWRTANTGPGRDPEFGQLVVVRRRSGMPWMLRECAARRMLAELHEEPHRCPSSDEGGGLGSWFDFGQTCETLRILALPYSEHRDYRPEWRLS